ncbi:hypothetical protein DFH07DRAFT_883708 [Mycena maculata]|uniref:Protein kinase domain-containing protein n=1 Tax=Mycena maculata TaxID=230809 RepID=A0AAD7JDR0_9AGAR|nr:hypothetical protein DFH07DRAFT_883708 [Mycena maculata]
MPPAIVDGELYWLQRRDFLESAGYSLRPKFQPGFSPPAPSSLGHEHEAMHLKMKIMDARRNSDDMQVMLKRISRKIHPSEVEIGRMFSSPPLSDDPRNHCVPILEVLQDPQYCDEDIIVMPLFMPFTRPGFDTVGEAVDCFRQLFEGLHFMHTNFVAHRDCGLLNIVQDATKLYPQGFHPVSPWVNTAYDRLSRAITRTECWPHYYFIDFGLSRRYSPAAGPPLEDVILGGDKSPPEHSRNSQCNPFPTDIYFLGNLLNIHFIRSDPWAIYNGCGYHKPLAFLEPLVRDMIQIDASLRPTISEVIERFDSLCAKLRPWHLRRPGQAMSWCDRPNHFWRQLKNAARGVPPLPPRRAPSIDRPDSRMRAFYTAGPELRSPDFR